MKKRSTKLTRKVRGTGDAQKARAKFRHTPEWTDWRMRIIENSNGKCDFCQIDHSRNTSKLQAHHRSMDKSKYEMLENLDDFSCLCSTCHKIAHQMYVRVKSKKSPTRDEDFVRIVKRFFKD